ncbi:MAG: hypothetical protein AAF628_23205 [Planctomycetota bacterium]
MERWGCFSKALAIYPDTNRRVRETMGQFLDELAALSPRGGALSVVFWTGEAQVGEETFDLGEGSSNTGWLKERFDRVGLAGVTFQQPVPDEAMFAFTRHLLEISGQQRTDGRFEDLWPEAFDSIELIERRFAGNHSGAADAKRTRKLTARGQNLARWLGSTDSVMERMGQLADVLGSVGEGGGEGQRGVDLLARLVELMPAEALSDRSVLLAQTEVILDRLIAEVGDIGDLAALPDASLNQLVMSVGRKLFYRNSAPLDNDDNRVNDAMMSGHAGDDAITDDVAELLRELGELPPLDDPYAALDDAELADEQLAVYLHYLARLSDPASHRGLYPRIEPLLDQPCYNVLPVLNAELAAELEAGGRPGPIAEFLSATGRMHLARACGLLPVERVIEGFPSRFLPFLDSIESDRAGDAELLESCVQAIGADRVLAATDELIAAGGFSIRGREEKILARPTRACVPLAHVLLKEAGQTFAAPVAAYLRRLSLGDRVAAPLRLGPGAVLPVPYLVSLTAQQDDGSYPADLRHHVSRVLADFVRRSAQSPEDFERRLYAVTMLRFFPSREASEVLREILEAKGLLGFRRAPAALRQAATVALKGS